jgi:hypothetical protein
MSDTPEEKAKKQITEWTENSMNNDELTLCVNNTQDYVREMKLDVTDLENRIAKLEDKKGLDNETVQMFLNELSVRLSRVENKLSKLEDKKDFDNSLDGNIGAISSLRIGEPEKNIDFGPIPIKPKKKNKWIKWDGGENPVPGKRVKIEIKAKDDSKHKVLSDDVRWNHDNSITDIIKYKVID